VLVVCPGTVMNHWLSEFHKWAPEYRVLVMHSSGGHSLSHQQVLSKLNSASCIVLTTYSTLRKHNDLFLPIEWGYVVLDEGHKIKNPDAGVTLVCKQLLCVHRLLLSGAPVQNKLREFWSLFDFIYPGKLGTLPIFEEEFCDRISRAGYTNASARSVQEGYKCALILRDMISPYILRRTKKNVAKHLPTKTEQVLLCDLTAEQAGLYLRFVEHDGNLRRAMDGKGSMFSAISVLRKLCNHPDLLRLNEANIGPDGVPRGIDYGHYEKSGKMKVLKVILRKWKEQGHRVLVFTQTRQMMYILKRLLREEKYKFLTMDGTTSMKSRGPLVHRFNTDDSNFLMLLTTRTGGLGINLTGADRVLLYDPDWNPATDSQAQERAYRIGQENDVTVYRLVTRGTIEEKIYHRQIFKEMLANKIFRDPKQQRFFNSSELKDLFSFDRSIVAKANGSATETSDIFSDISAEVFQADVNQDGQDGGSAPVQHVSGMPVVGSSSSSSDVVTDSKTMTGVDADVDSSVQSKLDDENILGMLFQDSNIRNVFHHDRLVNTDAPEYSIAETLADKEASQALANLRKSREDMKRQRIDVPTFTGRSGRQVVSSSSSSSTSSSLSRKKRRFGNSSASSSALALIAPAAAPDVSFADGERVPTVGNRGASSKRRVSGSSVVVLSSSSDARGSAEAMSSASLVSQIQQAGSRANDVQYGFSGSSGLPNVQDSSLSVRDGNTSSAMAQELLEYMTLAPETGVFSETIVDRFKSFVNRDATHKHLFRQLLRQMCTLERSPLQGLRGRWKLKEEYLQ
jgi:DNA excision repair protein ERCC-6